MSGTGSAKSQAAPNEPVAFDLPAQALASAIEAYSVVSGWQVIYDASLAAGRRSASVNGRYAPAAALRMLLAGTGLVADFLAADGAMLVPDPAATPPAPLAPAPHIRDYYGRIQASLKRAFCADARIRAGGYRIAIGFWIGSQGAVTRVASLGSTGHDGADAAFDRAVRRLSIGQSPPAGFEQPVVILVTPDLLAQCNATSVQPARVAQ
ncbi:secretin and TonB N-terminal domain-containing protein [Bradyrhizobium sp. Arg237L]|uniref:secretin and TonB N-terminal domain-containing protein n=1 Tax=Bradyrhizobium sp. Arg237L TaxID=3003352 RepID=UPI00249F5246|nr:secretin and TonB N-terminal domain-containing protein [Bradyrhizobium sp. Arg237L]MDI4236715.1 secretin and TonB N-terminal domain-containing protein [Bradyrhizobium sp. Arg237L]